MYQDKRTKLYLPDSVRPKASGYSEAGASMSRRALKRFIARSGSPNEDIDWNNMTLRQRSRMLYMSSPLATSAINTNRTKTVGVGLTMKSSIDRETLGLSPEAAKDWQKHTEREFSLWANRKASCDATGMNDFAGMQQLALISWLMSGDTFALVKRYDPDNINPYSLRMHIIEADRIRTPNEYGGLRYPGMTDGENPDNHNRIFDGVEVDDSGMVVAYFVHSNYPWQVTSKDDKWVRVEAYGKKTHLPNILHVMSSERPDQYRGVSYLAPAIEPILQLNRYVDSALAMALIQSYFTAWIIAQDHPEDIPWDSAGNWDDMDAPGSAGLPSMRPRTNPDELDVGPGTFHTLKEGEDIKFGNPNMPVPGFDAFVKTFCKLIGAGMGIPYDVLVNGAYALHLDIVNEVITEDVIPSLTVLPGSLLIAAGCQLSPLSRTMPGALRVYAATAPAQPIRASLALVSMADYSGGGGTSPAYVMPAATGKTLGGVKIPDGSGLKVGEDGTLSLDTASQEEVRKMLTEALPG